MRRSTAPQVALRDRGPNISIGESSNRPCIPLARFAAVCKRCKELFVFEGNYLWRPNNSGRRCRGSSTAPPLMRRQPRQSMPCAGNHRSAGRIISREPLASHASRRHGAHAVTLRQPATHEVHLRRGGARVEPLPQLNVPQFAASTEKLLMRRQPRRSMPYAGNHQSAGRIGPVVRVGLYWPCARHEHTELTLSQQIRAPVQRLSILCQRRNKSMPSGSTTAPSTCTPSVRRAPHSPCRV